MPREDSMSVSWEGEGHARRVDGHKVASAILLGLLAVVTLVLLVEVTPPIHLLFVLLGTVVIAVFSTLPRKPIQKR